jgi:D-alanine-D-alanine ligase
MKRKIAIVAGGDSSEYEVSLRSAAGIQSFLSDQQQYLTTIVLLRGQDWRAQVGEDEWVVMDKNDFSYVHNGEKQNFDFAYITIHGTPGENGLLQGYFDMIGLPYSCCGVLAAAMTFNKYTCNHYLKGFGVRVAESMLLRAGQTVSDEDVESRVGLPCFIKPNEGGSSFGVTKCKTAADIQPAIEAAFKESSEVMIEAAITGTEISNGVYKTRNGGGQVLPITEVVTHNEFFDYGAKYNGEVEEITPARLSEGTTKRVQALTSAIYDITGASGIIRIDYIISQEENDGEMVDKINLLEINTTPGMTATSFIPQQVRAAGLEMSAVLTEVIEDKLGC